MNKSAASAASPDYVKFQAVIKSAASAASLRGGRASGRLDHGFFLQFLAALAAKKKVKISDSASLQDCQKFMIQEAPENSYVPVSNLFAGPPPAAACQRKLTGTSKIFWHFLPIFGPFWGCRDQVGC